MKKIKLLLVLIFSPVILCSGTQLYAQMNWSKLSYGIASAALAGISVICYKNMHQKFRTASWQFEDYKNVISTIKKQDLAKALFSAKKRKCVATNEILLEDIFNINKEIQGIGFIEDWLEPVIETVGAMVGYGYVCLASGMLAGYCAYKSILGK